MSNLTVLLNPEQRKKHISRLLELDGFPEIEEDEKGVFCGTSLTRTPDELKDLLAERQKLLIAIVKEAGLSAYDPQTAPYSPDLNLLSTPQEVYQVDSRGIVSRRFFVAHDILPSTGVGIEIEKAKFYNRICVVLRQKNIRISRMQPHHIIYLQYDNFAKQKDEFVSVFKYLMQFDPGVGTDDGIPVLLGFPKKGSEPFDSAQGKPVNLEKATYEKFPNLKYSYDGQISMLKLKVENLDLIKNIP
jgi:hypothetical protein